MFRQTEEDRELRTRSVDDSRTGKRLMDMLFGLNSHHTKELQDELTRFILSRSMFLPIVTVRPLRQ